MILNVNEAVCQRKCIREFSPEPIPDAILLELVEKAGRAPSSKNTQPWSLHLLRGDALEALRTDYLATFDTGDKPRPSYQYSPEPLPEAWMERARQVGFSLFEHKGIGREDRDKRKAHNRENFRFFGAPNMFYLSTTRDFEPGTLMDCGMFIQNLMVLLAGNGYGSCPMYSAVFYPDVVARHLGLDDSTLLLCGLAAGTPLPQSHVNKFDTIREPISNWFKIY
jgi:nitroreductase